MSGCFIETLRRGIYERFPNPQGAVSDWTDDDRVRATRRCVAEERLGWFVERCPAEFCQAIDRAKIPNLRAWDEADEWRGGHPGLWLWSHETGRAKTRMLWRKFGELYIHAGLRVMRMSGVEFGEEYFRFHMDGEPRDFYRHFDKADVVMLDDLDKIDLTAERNRLALREAFDRFYEVHKAVLVTANEDIGYFEQQLGASCARRMRAVCREIKF